MNEAEAEVVGFRDLAQVLEFDRFSKIEIPALSKQSRRILGDIFI